MIVTVQECGVDGFQYKVMGEGHTLGNLYKTYVRSEYQRDRVNMCAYDQEHPTNDFFNFILRTTPGGLHPKDVIQETEQRIRSDLQTLSSICN